MKARVTVVYEFDIDESVDTDYDCDIASRTFAYYGKNGANKERNAKVMAIDCEYTKRLNVKVEF